MNTEEAPTPRPHSDALLVGPLERVRALLSASTRVSDDLRAVYIAEARVQYTAAAEACEHSLLMLEAAEAELARLLRKGD